MLNMQFQQRLVIESQKHEWHASPSPLVQRKPLEREAKESGHTTSLVKYHAQASFAPHPHPQGEEIFVLEGVFSDEHGDYPAGSYLRNPANSQHTPRSENGCTLFVKLNQFKQGDNVEVNINTKEQPWLAGIGGLKVMPLHEFEGEHTALVKWPAGERFQPHRHFGGEEILVLEGEFRDEHGTYPKHTWLRSPHMSEHNPYVLEDTIILVKTGHLPFS